MSAILVQLTKVTANLPAANAPFASTVLTVTDSAAVVQTAVLTGAESPPWSAAFTNVAVGALVASSQDTDALGAAIGVALVDNFTTVSPFPPLPPTFPNTTGIAVTQTA